MSVTARPEPPRRHPWLAQFQAAPERAFGDLVAGYAAVPPYERADAPDAARMLFGPLAADDPARRALGPAILDWLEHRRRTPLPAARPRLQRAVREVAEAFEIVALLDVTDAAVTLRQRFALWNEWTARLVLSSARDGRAAYWRMLALTQPAVARSAQGIDPVALAPFWLQICQEAGGSLPLGYLDLGLLGLRRLPEGASGSEAPWLAGLAQWALERRPSDDVFKAEWLALKALYPRPPARWRELIGALLATGAFTKADITPPGWWRVDPDLAPLARQEGRKTAGPLRSPLPDDCNKVIAGFGAPFGTAEPRIDRLMQDHRRYRDITGNSHYMVRAIHALGQALIAPDGDAPAARARKAQALAREGLDWEPFNPFLWSLWRDALAAGGAPDAAELVGWEFVRRLPDHPEARTQLATLLAGALHRPGEAEALLQDMIARFPNDAHARNQLAELLIAGDRLAEATRTVDAAFDAGATDGATYALRARLQAHAGRGADALATVQRGLAVAPSDPVLLNFKRRLDSGQPLPLRSRQAPPPLAATDPTSPQVPEEILRRGRLRRLRLRLDSADPGPVSAATAELRDVFDQDPAFAYAELLAARHRLWQAEAGSLPGFATAFEAALAREDRARLEELAQRQPRLQALTLVARALLGDAAAATAVETWLQGHPAVAEPQAIVALRRGLRPILSGGRAVAEAIAEHRAGVRAVVYDANEAGLDDRLEVA